MKISVKEIAELTGAQIFGDETVEISNLAKIDEAKQGDITFLYLSNYEKYFPTTKASAIFVKPDFNKVRDDIVYLEIKDPNKAFLSVILKYFTPKLNLEGIDNTASIHPSAIIGNNCAVGKNVVISEGCVVGDSTKIFHNTVLMDNVKVGNDTLLYPNVTIRENCVVGSRVIIHSGTVVGSDGFGFSPNEKGEYQKIPQIGNVIIEDDVELGSNVSIDRAAIGSTVIKKGVKIDNLVQIAHNVVIGEHTVLSGQAGIAGSSKIGKHCIIAGQVGISGHIEIADKTIVAAQSGISKTITKSGMYFGYPAKEHREALRIEGHIRNLDNYAKQIKALESKIKELEDKIESK
ncbi:MAG: UDP-3-O-(3-hydroxymyristoyl)glucosamine N-acyltransferase [Ignavibacteriaceae bacterium]|nr:UDP-3-O-(3-hydroxymyristoyl)glucosamine N-acyltransferase [Ignavibacteriaceae bacterium]